MKGWKAFLKDAPARVNEVIESGPFPLADYGGEKLTWNDKKRGMMRYKGSGGRGRGGPKAKHGHAAVVYFDPNFCEGEFIPIAVPDEVMERHDEPNVIEAFRQL